jgi:hypothetical protein
VNPSLVVHAAQISAIGASMIVSCSSVRWARALDVMQRMAHAMIVDSRFTLISLKDRMNEWS